MKKSIITVLTAALSAVLFTAGGIPASAESHQTAVAGKAAYVCDYDGGQAVFAQNEELRLPIASMCKVMTLLLTFEAVDAGTLTYEETVCASRRAAGMGGSQVFLAEGLSYPVEELVKTVAVCSANDSCVALAERIAGSEAAFVAKMNARAKELGCKNTLFSNCTGLPKEPQYSCAKDVAAMLRAMISHEKYFSFSGIPYEDFSHPDGRVTRITNTNKLLRRLSGCDGGKTGFTNEAGFCLAATAKRGETRLIAVVIGASTSEERFSAVETLMEETFAIYETQVLLPAGTPLGEAEVAGSSKKTLPAGLSAPLKVFSKRGEGGMTCEQELFACRAPVAKGDRVGHVTVYRGGIAVAEAELVALEEAPRYTWWEAFRDTARSWQ